MRDFKFRAWDAKHKVMIEGPTVYDSADHLGLSIHDASAYYTDEQLEGDNVHIYGGDDWIFIMNEFELMQYTGLKDKNGVEIYEGDVLRNSPRDKWEEVNFASFEVFFHGGDANADYNIGFSMGRSHYYGSVSGGYIPALKPRTAVNMIIIGNIYENPELLK